MAPLALAMFVGLFAFGDVFVGFPMMTAKLQLTLFSAFLFGMIVGYRAKQ